jgi:hypothetical protein
MFGKPRKLVSGEIRGGSFFHKSSPKKVLLGLKMCSWSKTTDETHGPGLSVSTRFGSEMDQSIMRALEKSELVAVKADGITDFTWMGFGGSEKNRHMWVSFTYWRDQCLSFD